MAKKQDKDKDALRLQGEETLCGAELKTTSSQADEPETLPNLRYHPCVSPQQNRTNLWSPGNKIRDYSRPNQVKLRGYSGPDLTEPRDYSEPGLIGPRDYSGTELVKTSDYSE